MNRFFLSLITIFILSSFTQDIQDEKPIGRPYDEGEFLKFRIHYGIINAGIAELELKEGIKENKKVFHAKGYGYTTGLTKFFFKVEDDYQSYFDKVTNKPYHFIRKIDEGGYKTDQEGFFNQKNNTVFVKNFKNNTEKTFNTTEDVQDIVSAFYYLRNHPKVDELKANESIEIDMFFDDETFKFKLKFLGNEDLKTKFGVISAKKFRPYVQAGRVFKAQESLTVWISNDKNKIPLSIKASLAVGSLKADLESYRGLSSPLKIIKK
jgi:hypothetical protein